MLQRDAFIGELVRAIPTHPEVMFLSADFGAEALDALREQHPAHFVHCGISEQAMIDMATGLALEGHAVFAYAMAPFLSLRALEQIKCGPGLMDLPMTLLSIGVGLGYADAGPTHYATEDLACLRTISGLNIYTVADASTATTLAQHLLNHRESAYVRMDRHALPDLAGAVSPEDVQRGWRLFGSPAPHKVMLVSHGRMMHECAALAAQTPDTCVAVEVIRCKPLDAALTALLAAASSLVVVDEQTPSGSLPSIVFEACAAASAWPRITGVTLPDRYVFDNGGRAALLDRVGLSRDAIRRAASL